MNATSRLRRRHGGAVQCAATPHAIGPCRESGAYVSEPPREEWSDRRARVPCARGQPRAQGRVGHDGVRHRCGEARRRLERAMDRSVIGEHHRKRRRERFSGGASARALPPMQPAPPPRARRRPPTPADERRRQATPGCHREAAAQVGLTRGPTSSLTAGGRTESCRWRSVHPLRRLRGSASPTACASPAPGSP